VPPVAHGVSNTQYPGGGKSKTPLIVGGVAAVGIAVGAIFMLGGGDDKKESEAQAAVEVPVEEPAELPVEEPPAVEEPEEKPPEEPVKPTTAPSVMVRGRIVSDPRGATILLNGSIVGKTPWAYKHKSVDLPITYTLQKKGYEEQNLIVDFEDGADGELGKKRQKWVAELSKEHRRSTSRPRSSGKSSNTSSSGKTTKTGSGGSHTGDNTMAPSLDSKPKKKDNKAGDNTLAPSF
jgi:hypothetical protein